MTDNLNDVLADAVRVLTETAGQQQAVRRRLGEPPFADRTGRLRPAGPSPTLRLAAGPLPQLRIQ